MIRAILLLLMFCLASPGAVAQDEESALDILTPQPKPRLDLVAPERPLSIVIPYAPSESGIGGVQPSERRVELEARLTPDSAPLTAGVTWRVFRADQGKDGKLDLVATAKGGTASLALQPGGYLVHAAFGRAGATKRIDVGAESRMEAVVLDAGGLRLGAVVGDDVPLDPDKVAFEVSQENADGEPVVVVPDAKSGLILRLPAGTYQVESRYGGVNAVVRAEIEVTPGRLTDATLRHNGAEVTMKLVSEDGGEALANTSWTVLNEGGDTVHESVGAFPRLILAEGSYTAVARHKNKIYSRDFTVEAGLDRDVEVRLSDIMRQTAR